MATDAASHDEPFEDRRTSARAGRAQAVPPAANLPPTSLPSGSLPSASLPSNPSANLPSPSLPSNPSAKLPSDPLQRLEVELGQQEGAQSGDERLYQEAQGLVEEAWGVLTECLGIRDGLLEACQEVERAMSNMQHRLGELSVAIDADVDASAGPYANVEPRGSEPVAGPEPVAVPRARAPVDSAGGPVIS